PAGAGPGKRDGDELVEAVGLAGGNDEVVGSRKPQDANHGVDVVGGKAPVHASGEIAEDELVASAAGDLDGGAHDLGRQEFRRPERRVVVREKTGGRAAPAL